MPQYIAKSLAGILEKPSVKAALDRTKPAYPIVDKVGKMWQADLTSRRPSWVYRNGEQKISTLDAFTVLLALVERGAIITLPEGYGPLRQTRLKPYHRRASKARYGPLHLLQGNQETHAFSVRMTDYSEIIEPPNRKPTVGDFKAFNVVNDSGDWHSGWNTFEFKPTAEEMKFFRKYGLLKKVEEAGLKDSIGPLDSFVHRSLAMAYYGSAYLETKILSERIRDEAKHHRDLVKKLKQKGITVPPNWNGQITPPKSYEPTIPIGTPEKIYVEVLEAKVAGLQFRGNYPIIGLDLERGVQTYDTMPTDSRDLQNILRYSDMVEKKLTHTLGRKIRAPCRAVELALFKHGFDSKAKPGNEIRPSWSIPKFKRNVRLPRGRIKYNALEYIQGDIEKGIEPLRLMYNIRSKSATINEDLSGL